MYDIAVHIFVESDRGPIPIRGPFSTSRANFIADRGPIYFSHIEGQNLFYAR